MAQLILNPTATAQWFELIQEAEAACRVQLDDERKSYLIFLLMRYTSSSQLANSILALEYLQGLRLNGRVGEQQLSAVGDKCLLFSGLFPGRAQRRRVRISYYVRLGASAYHWLGETLAGARADLFTGLAEQFVELMDILHAARELSSEKPALAPLQAMEIWEDTGSRHARTTLGQYSHQGTPLRLHSTQVH